MTSAWSPKISRLSIPLEVKMGTIFHHFIGCCSEHIPFCFFFTNIQQTYFWIANTAHVPANKEPKIPNWYSTSGLQSALAPTSKITLTPLSSLGKTEEIQGRKTPAIGFTDISSNKHSSCVSSTSKAINFSFF